MKQQRWLKLLLPCVSFRALAQLLLITVLGALIAGLYGVVHDQVTYTLSPEYFTKFKFGQFYDLDPEMGDRVFAGVIGFAATYWIGAILGWFIGRLSIDKQTGMPQMGLAVKGLLICFGIAVICGVGTYLYTTITLDRVRASWEEWQAIYQIEDMPAFYRVGCIHNMGYVGGVLGGIIAVIWVRSKREKSAVASSD